MGMSRYFRAHGLNERLLFGNDGLDANILIWAQAVIPVYELTR